MNRTNNYNLCQWEADDKIQRVDFNEDNAKIDAALGALAEGAAAIPKLAAGTYTGNSAASRFIGVGFTPKAVFVFPANARTHFDDYSNGGVIYAGLAVTGAPGCRADLPSVEIVAGGFKIFHTTDTRPLIHTNTANDQYNYIALG